MRGWFRGQNILVSRAFECAAYARERENDRLTRAHLVDIDSVVLLHAPPDDGSQAFDGNFVVIVLLRLLSEPVHVRLSKIYEAKQNRRRP